MNLPAQHPPYGWEHLPLRAEPGRQPDAPYWHQARVLWPEHLAPIATAFVDARMPWWELGHRPAFAAMGDRTLVVVRGRLGLTAVALAEVRPSTRATRRPAEMPGQMSLFAQEAS